MKPTEIENAMRAQKTIAPSADFTDRVMRAVRAEADAHSGLEFPWRWLVAGLAACIALIVVGVLTGARGLDLGAASTGAMQAVVLAPLSAAGSLALVWWSRRLT